MTEQTTADEPTDRAREQTTADNDVMVAFAGPYEPSCGQWEPSPCEPVLRTEEAIIPPIWYCLVLEDETYRFIRRADVLTFTIQRGQIIVRYKEYDDVTGLMLIRSYQEGFPIAGNLDVIEILCEESGLEWIDINPLLTKEEDA